MQTASFNPFPSNNNYFCPYIYLEKAWDSYSIPWYRLTKRLSGTWRHDAQIPFSGRNCCHNCWEYCQQMAFGRQLHGLLQLQRPSSAKPCAPRSDPQPMTDCSKYIKARPFQPTDGPDRICKLQSSSGQHCNSTSLSAKSCFLSQVFTPNILPLLQSLTQHLLLENPTWERTPLGRKQMRKRIWWS